MGKGNQVFKYMTGWLAAATLVVPLVSVATSDVASASWYPANVVVDGKPLVSDFGAKIMDFNTMVPFRALAESVGATVEWEQETQKVTMLKGDNRVVLKVGSSLAQVNGAVKYLSAPMVIYSDRTLVPLRFVSEALGVTVDWGQQTLTAYISTSKQPVDVNFRQLLAEGKAKGIDYGIGDDRWNILSHWGEPTRYSQQYDGLEYDTIAKFAFDGNKQVQSILVDPAHIPMTLNEIKQVLGEPDAKTDQGDSTGWNYMYKSGDYVAYFTALDLDKPVYRMLVKKQDQ